MFRTKILSIMFILLFPLTASSQSAEYNPTDYVAEPLANEKLASPISLECDQITVIEWKPSKYFNDISKPSEEGKKALNQLCKKAIDRYPAFLQYRNLRYQRNPIKLNVSLLPANIKLDGTAFRNLNDVEHRFRQSVDACCYWGLFVDVTSSLYLRNDPIIIENNKITIYKYFARTFLHEMAHVFNKQWRVREFNFPGNKEKDEELAEDWVTWLGYTFKTETSDFDLVAKKLNGPR